MATRVWSEAEARAELVQWRRSGEPLSTFSRNRGYSEARLRYWRRLLEDAARPATALMPVQVVERAQAADAPVEIGLTGGQVVRVRRGFDADVLMAVVRALEASC